MRNWNEQTEETENNEEEQEKLQEKEEASAKREDHFEDTYKLKPNVEYEVNGYHYKTDRHGRIVHCEGSLQLEKGKRNTDHQTKAGGEDRRETDEGGHIIATRFNGSGKVDNIVPMDKDLNHGEYWKLEKEWADALSEEPPKKVDVEIRCKYTDDSERPESIRVRYVISDENGEIVRRTLKFDNKGKDD